MAKGNEIIGAEYIVVVENPMIEFNKLFCEYPMFGVDLAKWLNVDLDIALLEKVSKNCTRYKFDFEDIARPLDKAFERLNTLWDNVNYLLYKLGLRLRVVKLRCNNSLCEYRLFASLLVLMNIDKKGRGVIPEYKPVFESRPITFTVVVDRRSGKMFYNGKYMGIWAFSIDPKMLYEGSVLNISGFVGYNGLKFIKHFPRLERVTDMPGSQRGVYRVGWVSIPIERVLGIRLILRFENWKHDECIGDLCAPNARFSVICKAAEEATHRWYLCPREWQGEIIMLELYYDVETGFLVYGLNIGPASLIDLFVELIPIVNLLGSFMEMYLVKYFTDVDEALRFEPLVPTPEKPIPASQIPGLAEKVKRHLARIRPELVQQLENATKTTTVRTARGTHTETTAVGASGSVVSSVSRPLVGLQSAIVFVLGVVVGAMVSVLAFLLYRRFARARGGGG